jgi:hypothetical protein
MGDGLAFYGTHTQGDEVLATDLVKLSRHGGLIAEKGPLLTIAQGEVERECWLGVTGRRGKLFFVTGVVFSRGNGDSRLRPYGRR